MMRLTTLILLTIALGVTGVLCSEARAAGNPDPGLSTVTAAPDLIPSDETVPAIVTVTLVDATGNPVTGLSDSEIIINIAGDGTSTIGSLTEVDPGVYETTFTNDDSTTTDEKIISVTVDLPPAGPGPEDVPLVDTATVVVYTSGVDGPPIADAGLDQVVDDVDDSGNENIDLDGSGSVDPDGTIVSYLWSEYGSQIATGETTSVGLSVGAHLITLTCTDNDGYTDSDDLWVTVLAQGGDPSVRYLDISGGFNMDAWCGPREIQAIYHYQFAYDPDLNLVGAQGSLSEGVSWATLGQYYGDLLVGDSSVEPYSTYHNLWHPGYVENDEGSSESGYIAGATVDYFIASVGGNPLLPGDWTEDIADPLAAIGPGGVASGNGMPLKLNALVVGSSHDTSDWQISESTAILPAAQQVYYAGINFVLCANRGAASRARYMRIAAIYGDDSEDLLWAFDDTADDTPWPSEMDAVHANFNLIHSQRQYYNNNSGSTGSVSNRDNALYEFAGMLVLNNTKVLKGIRVYDSNPSQNYQARGLTIFAASAFASCPPPPPEMDVILEDGLDWVYQNIQASMAYGGHRVGLTMEHSWFGWQSEDYTVTVTKKAGSGPGEVVVEDTAVETEKLIFGSARALHAHGDLILEVTTTFHDLGNVKMTVEVPFKCRIIGDVDGNGGAEPTDASLLINKLNGLGNGGFHDKAFDLDANGGAEPGDVSILINVLNGVL